MLSGDNGILQKATDAKTLTGVGQEKETIALAYNSALAKKVSNGNSSAVTDRELNDELDNSEATASGNPIIVTFAKSGNIYEIDNTGNIEKYIPKVIDFVEMGDYVDYDPMRGVTDTSKLTYTSPTGTGQSHGNGYVSSETGGGQKFTAKSELKWRVLSVTDDKIEIIPSTLITKDATDQNNGDFVLNGAIGYLYAEQELNEICKIYGYGYGANATIGSTYKIGGPIAGEETIENITETGARSITIEDINKFAKIGEKKDENFVTTFKELDNSYGNTSDLDIYYPTVSSDDGKSNIKQINGLRYTFYSYDKSKISAQAQDFLFFTERYLISSRFCKTIEPTSALFGVRVCTTNKVHGDSTLVSNRYHPKGDVFKGSEIKGKILPVVTIDASLIDISNPTDDSGTDATHAWKLK